MSLDVIIPVFNPKAGFNAVLDAVCKQTLTPDTIILMWTIPHKSSKEAEQKKAENFLGGNIKIVYVKQKNFDHGGTRRLGMTYSKADYVVCMTQDALLENEYVFEHLNKAFADENVAASYAKQVPYDNCSEVERLVRSFNYPDSVRIQNKGTFEKYGIKTYFLSDVCAMYRKSCYEETGGFVKKTIFNEDMLMAAALTDIGYTVMYMPDAHVIHSHNYSCMEQFRRNFDLAVSHKQYEEVFSRASSESEGIRMVKKVSKILCRKHKAYLIPEFIIQSGFKFMGYRVGKIYNRLPKAVIRRCTMNKGYWNE
ncbi:MAG: glycosyltransferase family 2 protein [Lachnospiraceae bacterium]|mgnify:FL=1|jgi:rhamnosyltransferase